MRILIVGGGIGGLTLAAALRRSSHSVALVERAPAWAPVGAGIVLGINAMGALRRIGIDGIVAARGHELGRGAITDESGRRLSQADFAALRGRYGPTYTFHRADLHAALLEACGDLDVRLDASVDSIDVGPRVSHVHTTDGRDAEYDLVVGADGIRSRVRELVLGGEPIYSGYTCWRFAVEVEHPLEETFEMWGRGRRLGLVPLRDRRVYGFAVANAPAGRRDARDTMVAAFHSRFGGFGGPAPAILAQITHPEQLLHNDLEEVCIPRWHRETVVLIGDAAHASTPNLGQGAAMAIEDVVVLAEMLEAGLEVPRTLAAWQERRHGRATFVQNQSRRLGQIGQWENRFACAVRNLIMRLTPGKASLALLEKLASQPI